MDMIEKQYLLDMIDQKIKELNKKDDDTAYWTGYQEAMFEIVKLIK